MTTTIELSLPGGCYAPDGTHWLDIETVKQTIEPVAIPNTNGETLKKRWRTFMIGLASVENGSVTVRIIFGDDEAKLLKELARYIKGGVVRYGATRNFDEMVLKGMFTHARRGLLDEPGPWPNVGNGAEWVNIGLSHRNGLARDFDIASRDVPDGWYDQTNRVAVVVHNFRDVIELIWSDDMIDGELAEFIESVMADYRLAVDCFVGEEF